MSLVKHPSVESSPAIVTTMRRWWQRKVLVAQVQDSSTSLPSTAPPVSLAIVPAEDVPCGLGEALAKMDSIAQNACAESQRTATEAKRVGIEVRAGAGRVHEARRSLSGQFRSVSAVAATSMAVTGSVGGMRSEVVEVEHVENSGTLVVAPAK